MEVTILDDNMSKNVERGVTIVATTMTTINITRLDDTMTTNVEITTITNELTSRLTTIDDTTIIATIGGINKTIGGISNLFESLIDYLLGYCR